MVENQELNAGTDHQGVLHHFAQAYDRLTIHSLVSVSLCSWESWYYDKHGTSPTRQESSWEYARIWERTAPKERLLPTRCQVCVREWQATVCQPGWTLAHLRRLREVGEHVKKLGQVLSPGPENS